MNWVGFETNGTFYIFQVTWFSVDIILSIQRLPRGYTSDMFLSTFTLSSKWVISRLSAGKTHKLQWKGIFKKIIYKLDPIGRSESSGLLQKSYLDRFPFSSFYSKTWLLDFDFLRRSSLDQFHLPWYGFWLANPFVDFHWRKGFYKRFLYNWEGRNRWFSLKSISIYSYTSLSQL